MGIPLSVAGQHFSSGPISLAESPPFPQIYLLPVSFFMTLVLSQGEGAASETISWPGQRKASEKGQKRERKRNIFSKY